LTAFEPELLARAQQACPKQSSNVMTICTRERVIASQESLANV
jgi:hypothetical protein